MDIIKDDELIYTNDANSGINSCGYNVNSLLFNSGISPIMTVNENKTNKSNISSLFNNLVVPNWALHYEPNKIKYDTINDDESTMEIVDDNLFDKLMDLAIYKDPLIGDNSSSLLENKQSNKHKITKHKRNNKKTKNTKNKHKKTRKN